MRTEAEKESKILKKQNANIRKNAIFGKSTENPMNKVNVEIVTSRKQYLKKSFRSTFKREKHFRNGTIAIKKEKCRRNLDKRVYIRKSISNLSKVLMKDFHYNYIKNKYGDKAEMLLTNTDSLMYKIKTKTFMKTYTKIKSYLTSVIILHQNITMLQIAYS